MHAWQLPEGLLEMQKSLVQVLFTFIVPVGQSEIQMP